MISFIVIGKNEALYLEQCFKSIVNYCSYNTLTTYEIIYIDSDSHDRSIEIALLHANIVIKISGDLNAALARNVGANHAKGKILYFIDGDMELNHEFYKEVFFEGSLRYPFISGYFRNNYYDNNGTYLYSEDYTRSKPKKKIEEYQTTTGGLFIISHDIWQKVGGMDSRMTTGEDLDLGLRLSSIGYRLLRVNKLFAFHNTENYNFDKKLFNGKEVFARSILYRKHLFNPISYNEIIKRDPTLLYLLFTILSLPFIDLIINLLMYFSLVLIKSLIHARTKIKNLPNQFFYQITRDIMNFLAFFFYYPKEKTNYLSETLKYPKNDIKD